MIVCAMLPILILLQAVRMVAGEYCLYDDGNPYYYNSRYCNYGCCRNKTSSYSEVCCSYNYNIDSSSSSSAKAPVSVSIGSVLGGLGGLSILFGIFRCCCAARKSSSRQSGTVEQPANTAMQTCVVNTPALSPGQSVTPVQLGAVRYTHSSAGPPPPYGQHDNVSHKTADLACPPPQDAKY